jgi:hypothetical protein
MLNFQAFFTAGKIYESAEVKNNIFKGGLIVTNKNLLKKLCLGEKYISIHLERLITARNEDAQISWTRPQSKKSCLINDCL